MGGPVAEEVGAAEVGQGAPPVDHATGYRGAVGKGVVAALVVVDGADTDARSEGVDLVGDR